jgi:hypothetical protein
MKTYKLFAPVQQLPLLPALDGFLHRRNLENTTSWKAEVFAIGS